jgi:peptidoglycan/LPS O-acetylase OafA/YrhL
VFVALFGFWWVKKAEWSRHHEDGEPLERRVTRPSLDVPPAPFRVPTSAATFRPDIEGLRAVAVLLVLVYHAKFPLFGGGFIGVDVFFVLSGFLITSLLLRELSSTGTVSLANFWARRARRLLPASGLVILATLIASRFMLDGLSQAELARDAIAACTFVVNIRFVAVGTDYLTSQLPPSPLLHFWSLAVEEQFYLVWPGLLLVLVRFMRLGRRALGAVVAVMWFASFAACVWLTTRSQPWAFFMLPTRAWELLTGAALAFIGGSVAMRRQQRALLGWIGLIVIVVCGVVFSDSMHFPGWVAAIPVLATALVVNAGAVAGPVRILRAAPLQWIGARSYAIYLWHFPMLILAAREWGPLSVGARLGILVLSVAVSAVSFHVVENPVRHSTALAASPSRSLVMGAWIALAGVGGAMLLLNNPPPLDAGVVAVAPTLVGQTAAIPSVVQTTVAPITIPASISVSSVPAVTSTTTTTAVRVPTADASMDNPPELASLIAANLPTLEAGVQTSKVPSNLSPGLGAARNDLPSIYDNGCILDLGVNRPRSCIYGDPNGSVTIVLFGDSHAAEWMPAMEQVATQNHWRLIVHAKKACPSAEIPTEKDPNRTDCVPWREAVIQQIAQLQPDLVVMSSYRYQQVGAAAGRDPDQVWKEGIDLTVSKVRPLTRHLLLLGDSATPLQDVPSCLAGNLSSVHSCMNTRDGAVRPGRLAVEREVAAKYDAEFIPTSDWMCTGSACPVIIGNVLMYRDNSHITATASVFLAPYVDAALRLALT